MSPVITNKRLFQYLLAASISLVILYYFALMLLPSHEERFSVVIHQPVVWTAIQWLWPLRVPTLPRKFIVTFIVLFLEEIKYLPFSWRRLLTLIECFNTIVTIVSESIPPNDFISLWISLSFKSNYNKGFQLGSKSSFPKCPRLNERNWTVLMKLKRIIWKIWFFLSPKEVADFFSWFQRW